MWERLVLWTIVVGLLCLGQVAVARGPDGPGPFLAAKTLFQTNTGYDRRIAIATDGVIVHRHGADPASLANAISSWQQQGYTVGRMFFADSDATNEYWTGKWDGVPHPDDVERNAAGEVVKCAGVRPYMLPTEGWIRYLEEMAVESVEAGADAVLPEEPLAHVSTGYEESFRKLWVERYGRPWEPQTKSLEARFLTAQLKNELYIELERRLARAVERRARQLRRDVDFVLPVHSLYSNVAADLVAPLGTSAQIAGVDGYIGQVWTGPVNWALHHYDSPEESFFASAYLLYDYFVELTAGSGRKLWLLVDPVEDNPRHAWAEFEQWYRHCVVAKLLFPGVDAFEVMPWPERIFLPGHSTGGGTPAPERFRVVILSATQALQELPRGGQWNPHAGAQSKNDPTQGIGVALADTLMWEEETPPRLQVTYGLLTPLVQAGVPVSACVMERIGDSRYLLRFKVIVLSCEAWKPTSAEMNFALVEWARAGGSLIVLGGADDLDGAPFWWHKLGHASPLHHLLAELGAANVDQDGDHAVGRGWVFRRKASPRRFGDPAVARDEYFPLVELGLAKSGVPGKLKTPGSFCLRRGPFIIAHAAGTPLELPGKLVDIFDPELPVLQNVVLKRGASGLYRDVSAIVSAKGGQPCVLHATHRLMSEEYKRGILRVVIRGPAETPAVVRLFTAGKTLTSAAARDAAHAKRDVQWQQDGSTVLARFPNDPAGAALEVRLK